MKENASLEDLSNVSGGSYIEYRFYLQYLEENNIAMTPEIEAYAQELKHMQLGMPQPPGCPTPGFDLHDYLGSID